MVTVWDLLRRKEKPAALKVHELVSPTKDRLSQGQHKFYIPKYLYKPPFGYPRFQNIPYLRYLASTPYCEMCITTIIDSIAAVPWDIVAEEGFEDDPRIEGWVKEVKEFFQNPNTNNESFEDVFVRKPVRDLLEINSGVLVKVFNLAQKMVEIVAVDASSFTKNPDIHGMFGDREDIIMQAEIVDAIIPSNIWTQIPAGVVTEKAAYFQYGWMAGPAPVPFGKREIIWMERNQRTDEFYPAGPVQVLARTLQMLLYMIDSDLQYYNDNNIPKGIIGLDGASDIDIEAFKQMWNEKLRSKDEFGNWRRDFHNVPIMNFIPKFERIEFSSQELQVIEKQMLYMKMVWASFGVTPTELGYTEDAKGTANQIVQSKVFRKKTIHPILRLKEGKYTQQIIKEEFGYPLKFKFLMFDIDEERQKWELYDLQASKGLRTVNEVRSDEGLEPVSWGDEPPRNWQGPQPGIFGSERPFSEREKEALETDKPGKTPEPEEPEEAAEEAEKKGFEGKVSHDKPEKEPEDEEDEEEDNDAQLMARVEGKAFLFPKEGEVITEKRLVSAIKAILDTQEAQIKKLIEAELVAQPLASIKALNDVIDKIKNLLGLGVIKALTDAAIRTQFFKGWENVEKSINKNLRVNSEALEFIQGYTFENIKGMNDTLATSLRQELSRAFMDNEGVSDVKKRITKAFDISTTRASAIARTEFNRANNYGKLLGYKQAELDYGIKGKKIWITTGGKRGDGRTSELCKRLHNQEAGLNEDFTDPRGEWKGEAPPSHVNCRSSWSFIPD